MTQRVQKVTRARGPVMLLIAAMVWGGAFVAQTIASRSIGPLTFNGTRTFAAGFVMLAVVLARDAAARRHSLADGAPSPSPAASRAHESVPPVILAGIACGIALCFGDNLQQWGITLYPSGVAASGRAGFLTSTYVVMVAIVSWIAGRRLQPATAAATVVCVVGMYLLCMSGGIHGVYLGDLVVLLGAMGYTAHILVIDRYAQMDGLKLTCVQFFTSGGISFVGMLLIERPALSQILAALAPILYACLISACVGYTLQTIGQRYTEPSAAAIIMSLESVFAALSGWLVLGETMTGREILGCALVFCAVILAQVPEMLKGAAARLTAGAPRRPRTGSDPDDREA